MNLYIITFNDKSKFYGGDYKNTKWLQIPDKPIKSIEYFTPLGKKINLKGYDSYYHFVEALVDISGEQKGIVNLEFAYLIAKKYGICKVHKINLQTGHVEINDMPETNKFISQLNFVGWR